MNKKSFLLVCTLLLMLSGAKSQTSMRVPYGSFEQWTTHPGYSISVFFFTQSIYSPYSTPNGWDCLTYPINESIDLFGSPLVINTNLPLVKASYDSVSVPDSNKAVRLESFMMEDIIDPNIYTIFAPSLDSMLTNMVFPSVLSTGVLNMNHFMPLMDSLLNNLDSVEAMLPALSNRDVNYLITGGIPLNGFEPTRLTGSYKYSSATSGDNGGVLLLGTHYNATTHRREVVGGGVNIEMTDITNYAPFTVSYQSLHDMDASFAEQVPDTMIVVLLSSASLQMQQGSALSVDNLMFWHDTVAAPDTCADVIQLVATPGINEVELDWSTTDVVNGYELEYGPAGFAQGMGNVLTLSNNTATLSGLASSTAYDCYVRTLCHDNVYGNWAMVSFTTMPDTCASIVQLAAEPGINDVLLTWSTTAVVEGFELEYGPAGFEQGTGVQGTCAENTNFITGLTAATEYDCYLRTLCQNDVYGDWTMVSFVTNPDTCASIVEVEVVVVDTVPSVTELTWMASSTPEQGWEVEYGPHSFAIGTGVLVQVSETHLDLATLGLLPATDYDFYVRSVCSEDNYGEWAMTQYTTPEASEGISDVDARLMEVMPNPAQGHCVVSLGETTAQVYLYTLDGRLLQTLAYEGVPMELQLPSAGMFLVYAVTPQGVSVRKVMNKE